MKKIGITILCFFLLLIVAFNSVKVKLKAAEKINQNMKDDVNQLFPSSYEYYASITDRELLKRVIDDDSTEIDNVNLVVLFLTDDDWELNIENYDNGLVKVYTDLLMRHVAMAYGYVLTESGIYYRCHFGHKVENENYNNNEY